MFDFQIEERKESTGPKIDFDARREYMVAKCGTANASESTIAIISGIVDCGLQVQDDARMEFAGNAADEAKVLQDEREKYNHEPKQYFETLDDGKGVMKRYKRWPVDPVRSYGVFVDIPSVMLDQGQFFGEEPGTLHPLRMLLNNEFYEAGVGKVVNKRGYIIREKSHVIKDVGTKYGLAKTNTLHKLAEATDNLNEFGLFKPSQMASLLGKPVLVEYRVYQTKSGEKTYLNEKVSLQGKVPAMMKAMIPELDASYIFGVAMSGPQNEESLGKLRQSVITTMQLATDFKGSTLEAALIKIGKIKGATSTGDQQQAQQAPVVEKAIQRQAPIQPKEPVDFDAFDDDVPF